MNLGNIERNFEDFKKEIEEVKTYIDEYRQFEDCPIHFLKNMYDSVESLLNEWNHLEGSINDAIYIIENIKE